MTNHYFKLNPFEYLTSIQSFNKCCSTWFKYNGLRILSRYILNGTGAEKVSSQKILLNDE